MKKLILLFLPIYVSGCATIVSDSKYNVKIKSYPTEADFLIRDESGDIVDSGKTPKTVSLKAGDGYFSKAHYDVVYNFDESRKYEDKLDPEIDNWYWANILLGGVIGGLIVDPITGAMYKLPKTKTLEK
jgi:hypothetical protein